MTRTLSVLLFGLFFFSRIFFINTQPVFFDSGENLGLFANPDFLLALISGHFPPHEGYILLFWPVYQIAQIFHLDPVYMVLLGQIVLSYLTVYFFYRLLVFIVDQRTALIASIIASLTPLFWITNVTIMMEIGYAFLFFLSLYFLTHYITSKKGYLYLHLSSLTLALSFLTHMLVILWLPLHLAVVFYKKKARLPIVFLYLITYLCLFSVVNILFIATVSQTPIPEVIKHLFFSKDNEFAYLPASIKGLLIALRNVIIPLVRNNTILIALLSLFALVVSFRKEKKIFIFGLLWLLPAFYTNQWWDSLLNGRHALIASFGFAFLTAYLVRKKIIIVILLIIYLLITSLPILNLLKKPIPYIVEANAVKSLPQDSLLIETHFAQPQVEKTFQGKLMTVNNPLSSREAIGEEIDRYLAEKKPVFISSGALSEPYGLYSGPYLHNITLSYANSFQMEPIIKKYTLKTYQVLNQEDNLIIYQIISSQPSPYPQVKSLKNSPRSLDYYDPLFSLYPKAN